MIFNKGEKFTRKRNYLAETIYCFACVHEGGGGGGEGGGVIHHTTVIVGF